MKFRDLLLKADKDGIWAFTPATVSAMCGGLDSNYRGVMLKRLVDQGVLERAAKGVYVNPLARSIPQDIRLGLVPYLRPGEVSYVSLETRLSEAGAISQISTALTLMTTGPTHSFATPWGVVDFTHTDRQDPLADGIEYREDSPVPVATVARAYQDLKNVGRNLGLVDPELIEEIIQEEADERQDFRP